MNWKDRAGKLKQEIPAVFLALKKKETPISAKVLGALAVGYALSPVDLIPDFIPVLGYLDDVVLLPLLIELTVRLIPREIMEQCRTEAVGLWKSGKPQKWACAIPIILLRMLMLFLLVRLAL